MVGVAMFRYRDFIIETSTTPVSFVASNIGPTITSNAYWWAPENQTAIGTIVATDPENNTLTYSIAGGDASSMSIVSGTGVLTFSTAPNYEVKDRYTTTVSVTDGTTTVKQDIIITIADVAE